jgi:hypothetical protein
MCVQHGVVSLVPMQNIGSKTATATTTQPSVAQQRRQPEFCAGIRTLSIVSKKNNNLLRFIYATQPA